MSAIRTPLPMLIRREYWEHRALLWGPLGVAVGMLLLGGASLLTAFQFSGNFDFSINGQSRSLSPFNEPPQQLIDALALPLYLVTVLLITFYLIDCLYAERKDRSVLFWKSLPVSDLRTVVAKFLTAMVVTPLAVCALALLTGTVATLIGAASTGTLSALDPAALLASAAEVVLMFALPMLWFAPLAACLMLASAWAKRAVYGWVLLPPILLIIVEHVSLGTSITASFLKWRLSPPPLELLLEVNWTALAGMIGGIMVTPLLLLACARIRRFRDAD